jgi:hypothetical protein
MVTMQLSLIGTPSTSICDYAAVRLCDKEQDLSTPRFGVCSGLITGKRVLNGASLSIRRVAETSHTNTQQCVVVCCF